MATMTSSTFSRGKALTSKVYFQIFSRSKQNKGREPIGKKENHADAIAIRVHEREKERESSIAFDNRCSWSEELL